MSVSNEMVTSPQENQEELEKLLGQLQEIAVDLNQYSDFLVERRALVRFFTQEKPGSKN